MKYDEAIDFLYKLEHGSIKLGLERIEAATEARGHPERRYQTVHVAGTNGKGSTATFLSSILSAAGYRSALHTSPHLLAYGERFRIDGRMISEEKIAALTTELKSLILEHRLSYFEATTLLAFELFAKENVDVAVIEVGMGGRLDATNVIRPALCVITGIDLDHTKSLGSTLSAIAAEKAGIMKPAAPLLFGPCPDEVAAVFDKRGKDLGIPVVSAQERVRIGSVAVTPEGTDYTYRRTNASEDTHRRIRLCGGHQVWNALLAEEGARLMEQAGWTVTNDQCERGLAQTSWPGRFEFVPFAPGPPLIFDVAHNPGGGQTVADTYRACFGDAPDPLMVVGMLGDKDHEAFLRSLRPLSGNLLLVPLNVPRAGPIEDVAAAAQRAGFQAEIVTDMAAALETARGQMRPVLITGSFRTVEAAAEAIGQGPADSLYLPERDGRRASSPLSAGRPRP